MKPIQNKNHQLGAYQIDTISLPYFDDKNHVLVDEIHTLAYFHKDSVTSCKQINNDSDEDDRDD